MLKLRDEIELQHSSEKIYVCFAFFKSNFKKHSSLSLSVFFFFLVLEDGRTGFGTD